MLKRILSLLVTLALVAGTVMVPVMAEGEETSELPVFYEGDILYEENFTYETTADFDTANAALNTAKKPSLTITKTNYEIVDGTLVGSYDATNNGDRICLALGSYLFQSGKYAVEFDLAMENGEYFPKRAIGRPWVQYYANETDTKFTTSKATLSTFGYSNETNNQFLFEKDSKIYKDYVDGEFYNFKFIIDVDNNKYYAYFEDELVIDGKTLLASGQKFETHPFDLVVQTATKQGVYDYKNIVDNIKLYTVYSEDELPAFTLASSSIENGATEVSVGAGSVDLTFSNKVASETIANATISGATGVTPVLSEDGKTLTLSWSELEFGATCTIDLSGVEDVYQQSFTGEAISFSTESKPPVFIEVDEIYSQNFDGADVTTENCGLTIPANTTAVIQNGKLNLSYDADVFTSGTSIVEYGGINWSTGKYALELKVSMTNGDSYPRRIIGNLRSGGSSVIQGAYTGNNTTTTSKALFVDKISQGNVVNGQEYLFKFVYDMDNNMCYSYLDGELITKEGRAFDKADSAGTLIFLLQQNIDKLNGTAGGDFKMTNTIDDIRIYEVYKEGEIPAFSLVSSTVENTEVSNKAGSLSLTFSNKLDNTTIANAVITGGIENPVVTPSLDATGKVLTLAWEDDLELDTIYTVDFSGVKDKAGQSVENGILTFATKTDYVRSGDYILAQDFNNTTVENCGLKLTNATTEITDDGKLYLTYSPSMGGNGVVQLSLPSDGYWMPKTTDVETGVVTGGGKYAIEMTLAMTNNNITYPQRTLVNFRGATSSSANTSITTLGNVGTSNGMGKTFYPIGWNAYEDLVNGKEYKIKYIVDMDNMKYYAYVNGEKFVGKDGSTIEGTLNADTKQITYMYLLSQYTDKATGAKFEMTNTIDDIYVYPVELVEHNAPVIVSSTPAANATNVSEETTVEITFDEQIDIASVNDSTLYITGSDVKILEKTLSEDKKTLTVSFDGDLTFETEQIVTLNGIKSVYGKAMTETTFVFTTREGYLKVTDNEFTINGTKADVLTKGTLKAVREVSNYSDKDYTATLILALYKGKALADILTFENQTIKSGNKGELSGTITIPELTGTETYTVKAMLWDSINGMIPLENPAIISNK